VQHPNNACLGRAKESSSMEHNYVETTEPRLFLLQLTRVTYPNSFLKATHDYKITMTVQFQLVILMQEVSLVNKPLIL